MIYKSGTAPVPVPNRGPHCPALRKRGYCPTMYMMLLAMTALFSFLRERRENQKKPVVPGGRRVAVPMGGGERGEGMGRRRGGTDGTGGRQEGRDISPPRKLSCCSPSWGQIRHRCRSPVSWLQPTQPLQKEGPPCWEPKLGYNGKLAWRVQ